MPTSGPILTIQTASLWASGDHSWFSGTGGPQGFDPFLAGFGGIVSSAGIAAIPFSDTVYRVDGGDQVTFVIALQNFSNTASAYDLKIYDAMPAGFALPSFGAGLTVTNGAGTNLGYYGDLFDPGIGLILSQPLAPYSDTSGANVALVTFTLQATDTLIEPATTISDTAQITSYAASSGGANLSGNSTTPLSSSTNLVTGTIAVTSTANQAPAPLASGQTDSFDITITLPEGTTQNLKIAEALPASGGAVLRLVSAQLVAQGANITTSLPAVMQPDGSIQLGRVIDTPDNIETSADQITVRVTVANGGTTAGTGTLNTTVSAADPNTANANWSTVVTNTVTLATPDTPPKIAGASTRQHTTNTLPVAPFSAIVFTDPDAGQTQTLTIHLSDATLGTLAGSSPLGRTAAGDYTLSGSVAAVQAAARALVFTPAAGTTGTETFGLTLDDGASGVATNSTTNLAIAASANPSALATYPISTQTVLTATPTGTTTANQVQTYAGPIDNVQSQFLYDGATPLAIAAQQAGMLISSAATATAIALLGGTNVVEVAAGSGFATSGAGTDTFLLHADQAVTTWNTLVNFHAGDNVTIYGVPSDANYWWDYSAGASGYTGATLRIDVDHDGTIDSSVTFAAKSLAETSHFTMAPGHVGGMNYLQLAA